MDLNSTDKIVLPWTLIMGFSNIVKYKYSWDLNRMGCVHWAHRVSFGFN